MDPESFLKPGILVPVAGGFFVLVGIVIAVVRSGMQKKAAEARRRWVHAAYSLWTGGEDCGSWAADRAQQSLDSWYGARGPGPFWDVIRNLRAGQTGSPAWDKIRALDLLRIGTAATYVDADQCWTEAAAIGCELQRQYRSWEELAQAFEAGMQAWQQGRGVTDPQQLGRVQRNLPLLRQQLWPAVPYDTTLTSDDD